MRGTDLITNTLGKMTGELKHVIREAENLLKTAEKPEGHAFVAARAKFVSTLNNAKDEVLDLEQGMVDTLKDAAHTTDKYVKDHPWNMAGAGAGVGLLVGLLIARKSWH